MADRYLVWCSCRKCERKCTGRWIVKTADPPTRCLLDGSEVLWEVFKVERAMFCPECGELTTIFKSVDVEGNKEIEKWRCQKCDTEFENEVEVRDVV